jgi:hypothetical protein
MFRPVSAPEPPPAPPVAPTPLRPLPPVAQPAPEPPVPGDEPELDPAAVLTAALDSLGQAHHRPFSRA